MRTNRQKFRGFSLTELLFALGVLSIGMVFVAGVFPAGVMFTMQSSERTIATVVAEEAFAKVRLYRVNLAQLVVDQQVHFEDIPPVGISIPSYEFLYPSGFDVDADDRDYYWSALCRPLSADLNGPVQVTVFVCRRIGAGVIPQPPLQLVDVDVVQGEYSITVTGDQTLISAGQTIVDNRTGRLYRVNDRDVVDDTLVELYSPWLDPASASDAVWVVSPPANSSRNPCIAVHQRVIRF